MLSGKLLRRHSLANGLTLELWDHSRPVAGDRWQVVLEARVKVPVTEANLASELKANLAEVMKALGPEIVYSQREVRNFSAELEVSRLLEQMASQFLSSLSAYLGHPDFAGRFIRKKYREFFEKERWYRQ